MNTNIFEIQTAYLMLVDNEKFYPNFKEWFWKKVVKDLNSDRKLVFLIKRKRILGVAIIKFSENKICAFKILRPFRNEKNGKELLKLCCKELNCKTPLISVPEELKSNFDKILSKTRFKLTKATKNEYRENKVEFFYN